MRDLLDDVRVETPPEPGLGRGQRDLRPGVPQPQVDLAEVAGTQRLGAVHRIRRVKLDYVLTCERLKHYTVSQNSAYFQKFSIFAIHWNRGKFERSVFREG